MSRKSSCIKINTQISPEFHSFSENLPNPRKFIPTKIKCINVLIKCIKLNVFSREKINLKGEKKFTEKRDLNTQGK